MPPIAIFFLIVACALYVLSKQRQHQTLTGIQEATRLLPNLDTIIDLVRDNQCQQVQREGICTQVGLARQRMSSHLSNCTEAHYNSLIPFNQR